MLVSIIVTVLIFAYIGLVILWTGSGLRRHRGAPVQKLPAALRFFGLSFAASPVFLYLLVAVTGSKEDALVFSIMLGIVMSPAIVLVLVMLFRPLLMIRGETLHVRPMLRRWRTLPMAQSRGVCEMEVGAFSYVMFLVEGRPPTWWYSDAFAPRTLAGFEFFGHQSTLWRRELASASRRSFVADPTMVFGDGFVRRWADAPYLLVLDLLVSAQGVPDRFDAVRSGLIDAFDRGPSHPAPPAGADAACTMGRTLVSSRLHGSGEGLLITVTSGAPDAPTAAQQTVEAVMGIMARAVHERPVSPGPSAARRLEDGLDPFAISWHERWLLPSPSASR